MGDEENVDQLHGLQSLQHILDSHVIYFSSAAQDCKKYGESTDTIFKELASKCSETVDYGSI